jgi:hypothetical protein
MRRAMFTSAECRAIAEEKLAQAGRAGEGNRKRLVTAAEAWFFLASKLPEAETVLSTEEAAP